MGSVDTSLYPKASGRAAQLAEAHSKPDPLILYGGWFCPFVQRSWIMLHEKNIPHQYFEINPYKKEKQFLDLNPRGLVPTLAVPVTADGPEQKPLYESTVICEYLDEVYNDESKYGPALLPQDSYERARCRLWIDHISTKIVPCFYRFIQHTPEKSYSLESARDEFLKNIKIFVREMMASTDQEPYFLGKRFSMVDLMLVPWMCRMFLFDHYKKDGLGIPEEGKGGEDEEVWKRWRVWTRAMEDRDSVKDTLSTPEQYIGAYKRYAEDTTQSQVGQATREGRRLP